MDTLLYVGLANAAVASVLALVAWGVGRAARRPPLTHVLWLLVLLKLVTPPLWHVRVPGPAALRTVPAAPGADESADEPAGTSNSAVAAESDPAQAEPRAAPGPPGAAAPPAAGEVPQLPAVPPRAPAPGPWSSLWKPTVVTIWLGGALVFWSVAALRIGLLRQLLRGAQPAPAHLRARVHRLADRLAVSPCPDVWLVHVPIPPMLWAVLGRPQLLLPVALWDRLHEEQRETLLAHELLHLRGRDHWVRRLELVILGLYWWHPVAWWARRELREAEEQRCDAWVVEALPASAAAYAQTLLDAVAFLSRARRAALVGASSMGQVRVLKRRLTMILQGTTSGTRSRRYAWIALGLGALLLPLLPTWAQAPREGAEERQRYQRREQAGDDVEQRLQRLEKLLEAVREEVAALRRERGAARAGDRTMNKRFVMIGLQPWANQRLDDTFHSGQYPGNNLAALPAGEHTLDGVPFTIGKQLIQLGSRIDKPDKVEGIKVGRKFAKLHILHATGYSAEDDTPIAEYTIHWEDGTAATIPVVYGQDVLDWWKYPFSGEPTRGKVVWSGENEPARKEFEATLRLYRTTWENPKPGLKIVSIDYSTKNETNCVPFCVAMTAEEK